MERQDKEEDIMVSIAKYREVIRGWQEAFNSKVFMKVEDEHKQWFLNLIANTVSVMSEPDEELPSLEGIVVEEECDEKHLHLHITSMGEICTLCNGTGTITRKAEWGDIDVIKMVRELNLINEWLDKFGETHSLTNKSGGRLRVKE